jgi:hypothetical protein
VAEQNCTNRNVQVRIATKICNSQNHNLSKIQTNLNRPAPSISDAAPSPRDPRLPLGCSPPRRALPLACCSLKLDAAMLLGPRPTPCADHRSLPHAHSGRRRHARKPIVWSSGRRGSMGIFPLVPLAALQSGLQSKPRAVYGPILTSPRDFAQTSRCVWPARIARRFRDLSHIACRDSLIHA